MARVGRRPKHEVSTGATRAPVIIAAVITASSTPNAGATSAPGSTRPRALVTSTSAVRIEAPSTAQASQCDGQLARRGEHADCRTGGDQWDEWPPTRDGSEERDERGERTHPGSEREQSEGAFAARVEPVRKPYEQRGHQPGEHVHAHHGHDHRSDPGTEQTPAGVANESTRPAFDRPVDHLGDREERGDRRRHHHHRRAHEQRVRGVDQEQEPAERRSGNERRRFEPGGERTRAVETCVRCSVANRPHQRGERRRADRDENEEERHQHQRRRPRAQGDPERGDQRTTCEAGDCEHGPRLVPAGERTGDGRAQQVWRQPDRGDRRQPTGSDAATFELGGHEHERSSLGDAAEHERRQAPRDAATHPARVRSSIDTSVGVG